MQMEPNYDDPIDLRGQEEHRRNEANRIRLAKEVERSDIKWQMGSKRGRRIIWRLLDEAGIHRSSFDKDPYQMAFNEGWRNAGNALLAKLDDACPDLYLAMLKEHSDGRSNVDGNGTANS
jgi:hypothetical protein